jgi:hypothetical protein
MRFPKHQAEFFNLLSTVFYYLISGKSHVGYLAQDEWNRIYQPKYNHQVCQPVRSADSQKQRTYECIIIESYEGEDEVLNAEGVLDGETDASDNDEEDDTRRQVTCISHGMSWDSRDKKGEME